MGQNDPLCVLPATGRAAAYGPHPAWADDHHLTQLLRSQRPIWSLTNRNPRAGCGFRAAAVYSQAQARNPHATPHPYRPPHGLPGNGCAMIHLSSVDIPTPGPSAICLPESPSSGNCPPPDQILILRNQRDPHRILAKFNRPDWAHSSFLLLRITLSRERHQTVTGPSSAQTNRLVASAHHPPDCGHRKGEAKAPAKNLRVSWLI